MRRTLWLLPLALLVAGPVASAPAEGGSGTACHSDAHANPGAAPESLAATICQDPAPVLPQSSKSDNSVNSSQPAPVVAAQPVTVPEQPRPVKERPSQQILYTSPPPLLVYPAPATAPGNGSSCLPPVAYSDAPSRSRGFFPRLFHRDDASMPSGPACSNEVIITAAPAPHPMPVPQPPSTAPAVHVANRVPSAPACPNPACTQTSAAMPVQAAEPKQMPMTGAASTSMLPIELCATKEAPEPSLAAQLAGTFPIRPVYLSKIGHAGDMSWLTGQVYRLQSEGELCAVRYAASEQDRNGGMVVLDTNLNLKSLHDGDLVSVYGTLHLDAGGVSLFKVPVYKADRVFLIERGNP
jgi:hypothetical protein